MQDVTPVEGEDGWHKFLLEYCNITDLWTFSGRALSFQPALDAGEAKQVSAAQSGQSVFARCCPRLETDGAVVAFALLAVRWLDRGRGHREWLEVDMIKVANANFSCVATGAGEEIKYKQECKFEGSSTGHNNFLLWLDPCGANSRMTTMLRGILPALCAAER